MKKSASLIAALFMATIALVACTKKETSSTTTTTTTTTTGDAKPADAGNSVGVPECDDYIGKYEKCIGDKVPEMARGPLKDAFEKTRTEWKSLAATPEGKQGLATACKMALDAAKQAMGAYGCEM